VNRRTLVMGAALTVVLVSVAGCGRRGPLEPPVGASVAPRPAASDRMIAPVAQAITPDSDLDNPVEFVDPNARSGEVNEVKVAPSPIDPNKRNKPFFLDPLVK
jgi:predicted small lipoprotein YifL